MKRIPPAATLSMGEIPTAAEIPLLSIDLAEGGHDGTTSRRRWLIRYLAIAGVSTLGPFSVDMYLPALPSMASAFSASEALMQLTITAFLIGIVLGQLVVGPISDSVGRRKPLLIGLVAYVVGSLLCIVAPSIEALLVLRFVQGLAAAAGLVIGMASVRDLYAGTEAARFFSRLQLAMGLGPIASPILGAQVLRVTSWKGVFVTQGVIGVVLVVAVSFGLSETLAPRRRRALKLEQSFHSLRKVAMDRHFLRFALPAGLAGGSSFAYISGSSFVLQGVYGVSAHTFGLLFGLIALSLVFSAQVNGFLVGSVGPERLLQFGLSMLALGPMVLLVTIESPWASLVVVVVALYISLIGFGFTNSNAAALALTPHPESAGSGAALIGTLRLSIGAITAPLAGIAGADTALPMTLIMLVMGVAAAAVYALLRRASSRSA